MSRMNPKEKRRGGQRDDSALTVGLNKKELVELLERTRRRCEEYERKQEELILKRSGILIVKSNMNYTKYCNVNEILGFINTFSQNSACKMYENATKLGRFVK